MMAFAPVRRIISPISFSFPTKVTSYIRDPDMPWASTTGPETLVIVPSIKTDSLHHAALTGLLVPQCHVKADGPVDEPGQERLALADLAQLLLHGQGDDYRPVGGLYSLLHSLVQTCEETLVDREYPRPVVLEKPVHLAAGLVEVLDLVDVDSGEPETVRRLWIGQNDYFVHNCFRSMLPPLRLS